MLRNHQWINRNQRGNKKLPTDKRKWKHSNPTPIGTSKGSSGGRYSNNILPQETRKSSNKQPKLIRTKHSYWRNPKKREEINEIET